jgi:predicted DNA-binding protein
MSNRPRDSVKWSETIQVSVSTETKEKVATLATTKGKSQSSVARELILLGLEKELSLDV